MVTMTLVGAWHGAAWSYVLFGALHGAALVINQVWGRRRAPLPAGAGWFLTIMFVALSTVLFRSEDVIVSGHMWSIMFGVEGLNMVVHGLDLV